MKDAKSKKQNVERRLRMYALLWIVFEDTQERERLAAKQQGLKFKRKDFTITWQYEHLAAHTDKCIAGDAVYIAAKGTAYRALWPHYCCKCGGRGGFSFYEDVVGDGGPRMPTYDPCPECSEKGVCPRCGKEVPEDWYEAEQPCPHCKWNWGKNPDDEYPEYDECECFDHAINFDGTLGKYLRPEVY